MVEVVVVVVAFFLACEESGRIFDNSFPAWRLARAHEFHSLGQDQSTVAQRAETTVTECFLTIYV